MRSSQPLRVVELTTGDQSKSFLYRIPDTGELVDVRATTGEILEKEEYGFLELPDGNVARRAIGEELKRDGITPRAKTRQVTKAKWPLVSVNAGVNPNQADELREHWRQNGVVGCRVLENGDVEWADQKARKKDCESRGLFDRDGGYGDPQPHNL